MWAVLGISATTLSLTPDTAQAWGRRHGCCGGGGGYGGGYGGGCSGGYGYGCGYRAGYGSGDGYAGDKAPYGYASNWYSSPYSYSSAYYPSTQYSYGSYPSAQYSYGSYPSAQYSYGSYPSTQSGYYPSTQYLPQGGMSSYSTPGYPMAGMDYGQSANGYQSGYTAANSTVNLSDSAFEPRSLTIQPGTIVQFVNRGNNVHTVSDADRQWDSGDIQPGASFSARFQFPGTYRILCRYHPSMTGTITVSDNASRSNTGIGGAALAPNPTPASDANRLPNDTNRQSNDTLSSEDAAFIREAASGGMLEVRLGQLAGERAANADVRQFGQRMVMDHENVNKDVMAIAERKGVNIAKNLSQKDQAAFDKLKDLRGADFDRSYMKSMVKDHEEDVKTFENESRDAKDADVKAFAARVLPFLKNHLTMAREVEGKVKEPSK